MRLVLAAFIEEQQKDRFSTWPLHITVLPPFEAPNSETVIEQISEAIKSSLPIVVQIGEHAKFGQNRIVQKIIPNQELTNLHQKLLSIAEQNNWEVAGRYTGKYFTPHITVKQEREYTDSTFKIDSIALVRSDGLGYKSVVGSISAE